MDEAASRQLSLVPYSNESTEVVLRRGNAIVLYDYDSKQVSVRHTTDSPREVVECPYCRRPLHNSEGIVDDDNHGARQQRPERPFVDPDYFAMLAASQRPSPRESGQSTPNRRIIPAALRSGRSRDVSATSLTTLYPDVEAVESDPVASTAQGISSSALSPGYFKQFFTEQSELGRGGNGVVLLVEHVIDGISLGQFACKRIPVGDSRAHLEKVIKEVRLLHTVSHPNLVAYHHTWLEDHQPSKFGPSIPCLWIIQDYCNGGDLHRYVVGHTTENSAENLRQKLRRTLSMREEQVPKMMRAGSRISLEEIVSFFKDMTSGLHHLHSKGYIHRDLKPSNCLLTNDGGRTRLLISDFGEVQSADAIRNSSGATGTISYCAPEVVQQGPDGTFGNFSKKSDIFSLGMIVYFMCFGRLPYVNAVDDLSETAEDFDELRAEIIEWRGFEEHMRSRPDIPERLYKYLKRLLSVNPDERPTTEEILTSIRGGTSALDDTDWSLEDTSPRVVAFDPNSPPDLPYRRRRYSGLASTHRPNLPASLPIRRDAGTVSRSQSPRKHRTSRPTSPTSMTLSQRTLDLPAPSAAVSSPPVIPKPPPLPSASPPLSPRRLILPPPPPPQTGIPLLLLILTRILHAFHSPLPTTLLRTLLFGAKLLSLFWPCTPFAPTNPILYPLLGLAALDLGLLAFDLRLSAALAVAHWLVLSALERGGVGFCQGL